MKRTNLSRRVSLQARNGIKPVTRNKQVRVPPTWRQDVADMHGTWCIVCHEPAQDAHHLLTAGSLRRELSHLSNPDLEAVLGDPRNGAPVCRTCHERHHSRARPIPRAALRPSVFVFAADHGLEWLLARNYPDNQEDET